MNDDFKRSMRNPCLSSLLESRLAFRMKHSYQEQARGVSSEQNIATVYSSMLKGNAESFPSHLGLAVFRLKPSHEDELQEQDKSSDIEQQPPFGDRKISNIQPQNRGGGLQNKQKHHIILTKYEAVHPTTVSENNSSSGMLII